MLCQVSLCPVQRRRHFLSLEDGLEGRPWPSASFQVTLLVPSKKIDAQSRYSKMLDYFDESKAHKFLDDDDVSRSKHFKKATRNINRVTIPTVYPSKNNITGSKKTYLV